MAYVGKVKSTAISSGSRKLHAKEHLADPEKARRELDEANATLKRVQTTANNKKATLERELEKRKETSGRTL